jgi:N-acetylmuramoyl-L-alanine amidase
MKLVHIIFVKRLISSSLVTFLLLFFFVIGQIAAVSAANDNKYKIKTIFIDPGHGGSDPGCHGVFSKEADVALKISLLFGAMIEAKYPDVKVIYARTTDQFVDLYERAVMANKANADLFICIHCNASPNHSAFGTETYTMGLHRTDDNFQVAKRENSVILLENDYQSHYEGFDPNDPASYIMFSMLQNAHLDQSVNLASKIQDQFEDKGRFNRGVMQAGFAVLVHTSMPSILVETGFLTNPEEEKYMNTSDGQQSLASSIFNAFADYKVEMETKKGAKKTTTTISIDKPKKMQADSAAANANSSSERAPNEYYKVQFYSSATPLNLEDERVKSAGKFTIEQDPKGIYHYLSKSVSNANQALQLQNEFRKAGFKDAFMVPYKNGRRQATNNVGDY